MNKVKQVTLLDRIRAAVESFKDGKPKRSIHLGLRVVRCDECERGDCDACDYKREFEALMELPDCNTCGSNASGFCDFCPKPGERVRINCPLWEPREAQPNE
jgi:hypothetical protein